MKIVSKSEFAKDYRDDTQLFRRRVHKSPLMPFLLQAGYKEEIRLLTPPIQQMIRDYLDEGVLPC